MTAATSSPRLIQGGMGVAVSGWRLARAVAHRGQLGVVSGVAIGAVLARRLQDGDHGGELRRALAAFPNQDAVDRILGRYFLPGGRAGAPYRAVPVPRQRANRLFLELTVAGSFAEVWLAKYGHGGQVGINLMEKVQIPTLPALYGALLAGVDWVLMGAGIPDRIPAAIERLREHLPTKLRLDVVGAAAGEDHSITFDPGAIVEAAGQPLPRPRFVAIVSSHVLAMHLARSETGRPWGLVVELPVAGGHNAPPRGRLTLSEAGEPIYGPRDVADLGQLRELGIPFWLAGGYASPARLREALEQGASGVQVGTAYALCEESGLEPGLKRRAREAGAAGTLRVHTDPLASPTGYPFKVAPLVGTGADPAVQDLRRRRCDLGYMAVAYRRADGEIGYRCPAEPMDDFTAKDGELSHTEGRLCLCNGLMAAAGMPQHRRGQSAELPLLTLGDGALDVLSAIAPDGGPYSAADVIEYMLGSEPTSIPAPTFASEH